MSGTGLLRELTERLGSPSEARWLARELEAGAGRGHLDPEGRRRLEALVQRRLAGEPLQYVLGRWAFRTLELAVDRRALIPRPETEQVVEVALGELATLAPGRPDPRVVDLGTGTGAIALSVALEGGRRRPGISVWATDRDLDALTLAGENLRLVAEAEPAVTERVELRAGDWFGALEPSMAGSIDLVVSNPPYVDPSEWDALAPEVRAEPRHALLAGVASDGTPGGADIERILEQAPTWLARPGSVVVELAPHHAVWAPALARRLGYREARVEPDLAGRPRALVGRLR